MEKTCENCKYENRGETEQPCCSCIHNAIEKFEPKEDVWIPCSEKMPENMVEVLVWFEYFRYGEYNRLFQTIGIGYTFNGEWISVNGQSGWYKLKVIAWMPLPKPYKEGDVNG